MHTTSWRKVGGSVMLTVPPAVLEEMHLSAGTVLGLSVEGGRMVVEVKRDRKYSLDELLAQCNFDLPMTEEEREWLDSKPVGREEI